MFLTIVQLIKLIMICLIIQSCVVYDNIQEQRIEIPAIPYSNKERLQLMQTQIVTPANELAFIQNQIRMAKDELTITQNQIDILIDEFSIANENK